MDDQDFKRAADHALNDLYKRLAVHADQHGFEVDFNAGVLAIEFEDPPTKFVVSPNSPVRQIWVSARLKSFKLDWDGSRREFVLPASGQSLPEVLASTVGEQLGEQITL